MISGRQGKIDAAAFFQLIGNGTVAFGGEGGWTAMKEAPEAFGVEDGDRAFAFRFDPPARQNEHRGDWNGAAVQGGEFSGKPVGIALGLVDSVAVGRHGRGEAELLAVENDLVPLLAVGSDAAGLAPGFGLDGEDTRGRDNDVIDVPWLATRFLDFHVVKHADGIRRELIEDLAGNLFSQKTKAVIHIAPDGA